MPQSSNISAATSGAETPAPAAATSASSPVAVWPGTAWPTIQPTLHFSLHSNRDGEGGGPSQMLFSPSGTRVVMTDAYPRFWTWQTLSWHAPDLAAIALLLAVLWLVRNTARIIRGCIDQRILGHWYCRKCDYDLTPPCTDPHDRKPPTGFATLCPECGTSTSKRRPRRHAPPRATLFRPLVALLLAGAAAAWVFDEFLETTSTPSSEALLWPSPLLSRVLSVYALLPTIQRSRDHAYGRIPDAHDLFVFDLPSGHLAGRVIAIPDFCGWGFTKDEHWCVGQTYSALSTVTGLAAFNIEATPPRIRNFAFPGNGQCALLPGPSDAHHILVRELARTDGLPWHREAEPFVVSRPTAAANIRLWSLDAESGAWTKLIDIPVQFERPHTLFGLSFCCFPALDGRGKDFTAVVQESRQMKAPNPIVVISASDGAIRSRRTLGPPGCYVGGPGPQPDGFSVRLGIMSSVGSTEAILNTRDCSITPVPAPSGPCAIGTPDGLLSFQYPAMPARFVAPDGTVAAVPCVGPAAAFPTIDHQGRWAWTPLRSAWPPSWLTDAVGYRLGRKGEVVLWDLEPVKQRVRAAIPKPPAPTSPH